MYNFIKNQWILGAYDETNIANCVTKKYITQAQADVILEIAQVSTQ